MIGNLICMVWFTKYSQVIQLPSLIVQIQYTIDTIVHHIHLMLVVIHIMLMHMLHYKIA